MIGVAHDHHVAVVDLVAVDQAGVLGGSGAAPAAGLDLDLDPLVGQFQEPGRAREQAAAEVGEQAEGVDVDVQVVDHAGQLLDLGRCVELGLVAHEVVEAAVSGGEAVAEVLEIELVADVDGAGRHAEAGGHLRPVPVELGAEQPP